MLVVSPHINLLLNLDYCQISETHCAIRGELFSNFHMPSCAPLLLLQLFYGSCA